MITFLDTNNSGQAFPPLVNAVNDPDGLIAIGGCLSEERLLNAYRQGIFPWFNPGEIILWWSPNPRLILFPKQLKISRSLARTIRRKTFSTTYDKAFTEVIKSCAKPREYEQGTWIGTEMQQAYIHLHRLGHAHSIEAWSDNKLVGGLYGVVIGQVFFGESMFHTETDASKVAFVFLVKKLQDWGYQLIDCQVHTPHLVSLGAKPCSRAQFLHLLNLYCDRKPSDTAWK